jgi:hypothetical protein
MAVRHRIDLLKAILAKPYGSVYYANACRDRPYPAQIAWMGLWYLNGDIEQEAIENKAWD